MSLRVLMIPAGVARTAKPSNLKGFGVVRVSPLDLGAASTACLARGWPYQHTALDGGLDDLRSAGAHPGALGVPSRPFPSPLSHAGTKLGVFGIALASWNGSSQRLARQAEG
jgi:hypothetical protein